MSEELMRPDLVEFIRNEDGTFKVRFVASHAHTNGKWNTLSSELILDCVEVDWVDFVTNRLKQSTL